MTNIILSSDSPLDVQEISKLIAKAIHPGPGRQVITQLFKKVSIKHSPPRVELLTDDDWLELKSIWYALPEFRLGIPMAEWGKYENAFNKARPDSEWILMPIPDDLDETSTRQAFTIRKHKEELIQAIQRKEIAALNRIARSPISNPEQEQLESALVTVEEFRKYGTQIGITVSVEVPSAVFKERPTTQNHLQQHAIMPKLATGGHTAKFTLQEQAILSWLKFNDYDPRGLPKRLPGKSGPKYEAWAALKADKGLFQSNNVFNRAWERLRKNDEIRGAE